MTPLFTKSADASAKPRSSVAWLGMCTLATVLAGAAISGGASPATARAESASHAIVVLVNDEPITAYEIEQRQRLLGLSANVGPKAQETFKALLKRESTTARLKEILNQTIKENRTKGRDAVIKIFEQRKKAFAINLQKQAIESARSTVLPTLKRQAVQELIEERLKLQEAKRNNVVADDAQVSRIINSIASRNKMNEDQFAKHLAGMGVDIATMRQRFRAMLSWNDVVRRRFGYQVAITERDVDRFIDASVAEGGSGDAVPSEITVQRVLFPVSGSLDQKVMAQRLTQADDMRRQFKGCGSTAKLAKAAGAKFENVGSKAPASIGEPVRTMLLNAKDGEMIPPNVGPDGIELWAVCGRKVASGGDDDGPSAGGGKRHSEKDERRQKELDILAKRHLKDIRQDATIDCRAEPKSGICQLL